MPVLPEFSQLAFVLLGALVAGFTTGFAGFGTGLVASGLWYHALPAAFVPPLVAMASVAAQLVGLVAVRKAFDWDRALPYLGGAAIGVPLGVLILQQVSPASLRFSVGAFLVLYAGFQLAGAGRFSIPRWGGRRADGAVGVAGGLLGGFAGLSGPLPVIWLQMRGGPSAAQRAVYQPFNLLALGVASLGMGVSGAITASVLWVAALCLPVTLFGAWAGARIYVGVSENAFRRIVLALLVVSGAVLVLQGW